MINGYGSADVVGDLCEAKAFRSLLLNKKTWDNRHAFENQDINEINEWDLDIKQAKKAHLTSIKGNISDLQMASAAVDTIFSIKSIETVK